MPPASVVLCPYIQNDVPFTVYMYVYILCFLYFHTGACVSLIPPQISMTTLLCSSSSSNVFACVFKRIGCAYVPKGENAATFIGWLGIRSHAAGTWATEKPLHIDRRRVKTEIHNIDSTCFVGIETERRGASISADGVYLLFFFLYVPFVSFAI